jgi:hypothetical protein
VLSYQRGKAATEVEQGFVDMWRLVLDKSNFCGGIYCVVAATA